jgi:hypothetical protein
MRSRVALVASLFALCGCGSSSTTSSGPKLSPQQSDNVQRDIGYIHALDQIMAPFNKPPSGRY